MWMMMGLIMLVVMNPMGYAETEPNDTLATANAIDVNSGDSGSLTTVLPVDIYDIYQVVTPSDGLFQVGVVPVAELRVEVTLIDSDGVAVLGVKDGGGKGTSAGVIYSNLMGGTYSVVVKAVEGLGDYGIQVNFAPIEEIDDEPNGSPANAIQMRPNTEAEGHLGFHGNLITDQNDFYVIRTDSDGALELTVFPDGGLRVGMQLRDTNGNKILIAKNDNAKGGSEKIVYTNLAAGMYFVSLYRAEGHGSYTLTNIFEATQEPQDLEPNNHPQESVDLVMDELDGLYSGYAKGRLGYFGGSFSDQRDFYKISTAVYGKLKIELVAADEHNVALGYDLFDSNLQFLKSNSAETSGLVPGIYYLNVRRTNRFGEYSLYVQLDPQEVPDPFATDATTIALNSVVENITINDEATSVYYRVTLPADGSLTIRSTYSDSLAMFTNLYNSNGAHIGRNDHYFTVDEKVFTSPNLMAGDYIIQAARRDGSGLGSIETEFVATTNIDVEPNDAWMGLPEMVSLDQTIVGHIGFTKDGWRDTLDYYVLDVPDDGSLTVTSNSDDTFAYFVNVWAWKPNSELVYLGRNDGWFTTDPRSFTKPNIMAGKYLIGVTHRDGYGNYAINFSLTPNRSSDQEFNDHVHQAEPIYLNDGIIGHLGYDKVYRIDNYDWYKVNLPADGAFTLRSHVDSTMAIFANLYQADGVTYMGRNDHWFTPDARSVHFPNLRAGNYYIQILRRDGYGAYEMYVDYKEQAFNDVEQNNIATMPVTMSINELTKGAIGYYNANYGDNTDFYRVDVPEAGTYKFTYQGTKTLASYCYLYASDMRTSLFRHDQWKTPGLSVKEMDIDAGVYYIQVARRDGYGTYTLSLSTLETPVSGKLEAKIVSDNNFPLAEVDCTYLGMAAKTDFSGIVAYDAVPPGFYTLAIGSGAKFYAVNPVVEIRVGETTHIDITLFESNKTAPANSKWFSGFPRDRYMHFAWLPSVSPDVADGGGYKLYINDEEPLDLGNVLSYRSAGFFNGVQYTCRLTVYDKFGNESDGKTVIISPNGDIIDPTPTPTQMVIEPTPTPQVGEPTPTPQVGEPTPTPTTTPVIDDPTPTPEEVATPTPGVAPVVEPYMVYEFDKSTMTENGWVEIPGGFGGATPGFILANFGFPSGEFPSSLDQRGAAIVAKPGSVTFLLTQEGINTGGRPALIRCKLKCNEPNASIAVGALKGVVMQGLDVDGTIGYSLITSAASFVDKEGQITAVFRPDSGEMINPFIQVAGSDGNDVTAWIDRVDVFILEPGMAYPGELFGDVAAN